MATVLTIDGLRIVVYSNDHRPAHVHVVGPNEHAVFNLNCPDGPLALREQRGFTIKKLNDIEQRIQSEIRKLCAAWRSIHGDH